ncbi:MAG: DUF3152 domain-containing protein [Actinomycetaceae bacterium]
MSRRRLPAVLGAVACAGLLAAPVVSYPSAGSAAWSTAHADESPTPDVDGLPESWLPATGPLAVTPVAPEDDDDTPSLLDLVRVLPPADELPDGVDADAYGAGIRGDLEQATGSGDLRVVEGSEPAPREAERTYRVRVEVERGLPMDRAAFADYVVDTLNDPRGWGYDGSVAFERVDTEDADFAVTLADGPLSIDLCAPLDVGGVYSCGRNGRAVLNADRFGGAIDAFFHAGGTLPQYRQYLVNHEVGHLLGHQHEDCPAPGETAPVMVQQSISLQGCVPNAWASRE